LIRNFSHRLRTWWTKGQDKRVSICEELIVFFEVIGHIV
jgi:hypothetical protein